MLFNSLVFAVFLPTVFTVYWLCQGRLRAQNLVLLLSSLVFYGWWDVRFLALLIGTSLVDYWVALGIDASSNPGKRKALLALSVVSNLTVLGLFKYYDFFAREAAELLDGIGFAVHPLLLEVALPVGISFYTFQAMSYTIDAYRRQIKAVKDPIAFLAFISFFPQLVAGPIERASNLLPQMLTPRVFDPDKATDGMRQMLWGFFKKSVIADNCSPIVNSIFGDVDMHSSASLVLGAVLFAFQIYGDFSGYSDIAIGCARLFGFDLMRNFAYPYFSRDIAEFWRRWHISLSTWFRDYVYVPLGGSRGSRSNQVRNVAIIFLLSGFWHGANWTFIAWGAINGALFLPLILSKRNRRHVNDGTAATWHDIPSMLLTFGFTVLAWIFFRSASIGDALLYLRRMASRSLFRIPDELTWWLVMLLVLLLGTEWLQRRRVHALAIAHLPTSARWLAYCGVFALIFFFGRFGKAEFIYFQF